MLAVSSRQGTRGVGMRRGPVWGVKKASVVDRVALHVGEAPDTAVHVCGVPSAVDPFMNCTVPVGLAPVPVPTTVAVNVTFPPEEMLVGELVTVVAVVCVVPPIVPVNEKFKTLFPPKASGFGSA